MRGLGNFFWGVLTLIALYLAFQVVMQREFVPTEYGRGTNVPLTLSPKLDLKLEGENITVIGASRSWITATLGTISAKHLWEQTEIQQLGPEQIPAGIYRYRQNSGVDYAATDFVFSSPSGVIVSGTPVGFTALWDGLGIGVWAAVIWGVVSIILWVIFRKREEKTETCPDDTQSSSAPTTAVKRNRKRRTR